ncbi:MAG TPA: beta-ketoacyl-[acyl-carrier-protein] synthase family protein [Pirellulales bacterium]|jgi:3-oxoacyl-[acyl-carrier-protein] synthase II|nr:beta-ketoacyl-[acyl-carrier-protein] synthase family protein [Pirellulales bacterium]
MRRRVVVTGAGWVTPLGDDLETVWRRLCAGESGVGQTTLFDAAGFPTTISAEVKDWDLTRAGHDPSRWQHLGRHAQFMLAAGSRAMRDSGIADHPIDPRRLGIYLGSGEGNSDFGSFCQLVDESIQLEQVDLGHYTRLALAGLDPRAEAEQEPHMTAYHLAGLFDAQGPVSNSLTACAASAQAAGEAAELIRSGHVDAMLAGGSNSMINPFGVSGFNLLTALSTRNGAPAAASRPFDRDRDGFVLGEGAGAVVLESLEHARARGARIYGELSGYGSTSDAYRITDVHPEGRGAARSMSLALADAGLNPADIDYISAHGTSTHTNDRLETLAIKQTFGAAAHAIPTSSIKSMTGHLITATGVIEMIISLLAIRDGVVPPTINYDTPDPECDLDYVPNIARDVACHRVLSNSFGFGGQNVSLVIGRL